MKKCLVALLTCVFAFSLALAGCSGSSGSSGSAQSEPDPAKDWTGVWVLVEMQTGGEVFGADRLQKFKDLGLEVIIELDEGGTGAFVMYGESMPGTWEVKSSTEAVLKIQDQPTDMVMEGGNMVMAQDDTRLVFEKDPNRTTVQMPSGSAASPAPGATPDATQPGAPGQPAQAPDAQAGAAQPQAPAPEAQPQTPAPEAQPQTPAPDGQAGAAPQQAAPDAAS